MASGAILHWVVRPCRKGRKNSANERRFTFLPLAWGVPRPGPFACRGLIINSLQIRS
jgi:hypothetical protein